MLKKAYKFDRRIISLNIFLSFPYLTVTSLATERCPAKWYRSKSDLKSLKRRYQFKFYIRYK